MRSPTIFTRKVTDWRNALRTQMNDLDTLTIGRSVDSLLNYETVKYFGAEERETARYRDVITIVGSGERTLTTQAAGSATAMEPMSRSEWPETYLVTAWTLTSTPWARGR